MNIIEKLSKYVNPLLKVLPWDIDKREFQAYLLGLILHSTWFSILGISKWTSISRKKLTHLLKQTINWPNIFYKLFNIFIKNNEIDLEGSLEWFIVIDSTPKTEPYAKHRITKKGRVSIEGKKRVPYNEVVTMTITNEVARITLDTKIWGSPKVVEPCEYETKTKLVYTMLENYKTMKIAVNRILFDNEFATKKIMQMLDAIKYHFYTRIKRNTIIWVKGKRRRLDSIDFSKRKSIRGIINNTDVEVKIIKVKYVDKEIFVATNEVTASEEEIEKRYRARWCTEEFYRDSKQLFGLEKSQVKTYEALTNHINFVCLACSLLSIFRSSKKETVGDIKRAVQDIIFKTSSSIDRFIEIIAINSSEKLKKAA